MKTVLTCKDCGSTNIIIEVVDFCADCRSYNIVPQFEDGSWDEASKEELEILDQKEKLRISKMEQERREKAIPVSSLNNVFLELGHLIYDYNRKYANLQYKYGSEFKNSKSIFSFYDLSSNRHKMLKGELKSVFISSLLIGAVRRLEQREISFKKAGIELLDRSQLDSYLKVLDFPNRTNFCYFNDMDSDFDFVIA